MIKTIHIKLLLLISLSILFGHSAFGQTDINEEPPKVQHVCGGTEVTYTVFGFPGSTIEWYIDGAHQTDKDFVVPDIPIDPPTSGSNVLYGGFTYNKAILNYTWTLSAPNTLENHTLKIQEISEAPAACPTGLVTPGLKVYVHAKPLIDQVSQTSSTCDGGVGTMSVEVDATVPIALSLQYRLKNSGGAIIQSQVTKNTTHTFLDVSQGNYTLEVLYVLTSDNAVEVKGSLQSQAVNLQPLADVSPLLCFESTNLAQGKVATQSSDYASAFASLAIDGNDNGVYNDNSVTHTGNDAQAWWQVDLGVEEVVDYIDVLRRTDCCTDRLVNFYVLLSNTNLQSVLLNDALKDLSVESYYVSGDPGDLKRILTLGNTARYVKIQLTGTNHLSLAEVKVMGCTSKTKADVNVFAEVGSCEKIVTWNEPIAIDNCPNVTLSSTHNSGATFLVGSTTVTYTATDGADQKTTQSFNVIVTKENNIAVTDVSGSSTPKTSDGSDNNNGNHCPDMIGLQAVVAPISNFDYKYKPGTSKVQFRVDRLCNTGAWSFTYLIGGVGVNASNPVLSVNAGTVSNSSGVISATADANYVLFTIDVNNVVGTVLQVDFTVSDGGANSAIKDVITKQHNIKIMPLIGSFE